MKKLICGFLFASILCVSNGARSAEEKTFRDKFDVDEKNLVTTGKSKYMILEPNYELVLEGKDDGKNIRLTMTVLNETKKIGAIETRVVEEKEVDIDTGKVVEDSLNYVAMDKTTGDLYYFGENVGGAWTHGVDGAKFGLLIPAAPKVGDKFYQEMAKNAQDRSEVISITEELKTPAGTFKDCLKTEETTPLEPKEKAYKVYAPGIGMVKSGDLILVKHSELK